MGYWDNLNQSGWWGQIQPGQPSFSQTAPVQQTQPTTTTPPQMWGGWQSPAMQQMASGWNLPAQQATITPPAKPAAPKQITPAWGNVGALQAQYPPKWGEMQSPNMIRALQPAGVPVHRYLPYYLQNSATNPDRFKDPALGKFAKLGVGVPYARLVGPQAYADGGEYTQPKKPTPPKITAEGGGGGSDYSGGYGYSSGWGSYKVPKQQSPWYMELIGWDISGA